MFSCRTVAAVASLFVGLAFTESSAAEGAVPPAPRPTLEQMKHHEHHEALELAPPAEADFVAVRSGRFSDPGVWGGALPTSGSFVLIPEGVCIEVQSELAGTSLRMLRVDGVLRFDADVATSLRVVTLLIGQAGRLEIGSEEHPITRDAPAEIILADRGPRDRVGDPMDLTGGIICLGLVDIEGEAVTPIAHLARVPKAGDQTLELTEPVKDWRVGEKLLIPGTSFKAEEDETVRIAAIEEGGRVVRLERALRFDRWVPKEIDAQLPVGHMTRAIEIRSENTATQRRGHIMLMHQQTGHRVRYARIQSLGRTRAAVAHTIPTLDASGKLVPGSDSNTIARYALHFHVRSGASRDLPPHLVEGCVVVDSPKHGIVNHGGNVIVRNNVTYDIDGSHIFCENGSELGAVSGNLCVRSKGSGDRFLSRDGVSDFGHGGHGIWSQSPLVEIHDNWAFGQAHSAFAFRTRGLHEGGDEVMIPAANLRDAQVAGGRRWVKTYGVPVYFHDNFGVASGTGLVLWDVQTNPHHDLYGVVDHCAFWSVRDRAIWLPYTAQMRFEDVVAVRGEEAGGAIGVIANRQSHDLHFKNVTLLDFHEGMRLTTRGVMSIEGATMRNDVNFVIPSASAHGRKLVISDPEFQPLASGAPSLDYRLDPVKLPTSGDISALLLASELTVTGDERLEGERLYAPEQRAGYVPVTNSGNAKLDGRTNAQLWSELGLATLGAVAPKDATPMPFTNALVGPPVDHAPMLPESLWREKMKPTGEPIFLARAGEKEGWRTEQVSYQGSPETILYFLDATPGYVELDPRMPKSIHPDDLKYGVELRVFMYDDVGGKVVGGNGVNYVAADKIVMHDDGTVGVPYTVCDRAGHEATYMYTFDVSEDAPRRLWNVSYFRQRSAVGEAARPPKYIPLPKEHGRGSGEGEDGSYDSEDGDNPNP